MPTMMLIWIFLLSSFVVACVAPTSPAGSVENSPSLTCLDVFGNRNFIQTTLTVLKNKADSTDPPMATRLEMIIGALKEFPSTYKPNFDGLLCYTSRPEVFGASCASDCTKQLIDVIKGCNFENKNKVAQIMYHKVLKRIFLPDPKKAEDPVTPASNMKDFVKAIVESSFELDEKTKSAVDCFEEKLFRYFERDISFRKEQGILDMTVETIKLMQVIAGKVREDGSS